MKLLNNNEQKLNEIIFAGRNKSYGAYAIRASYNNSLLKSLLILFSFVMLVFGSAFIFTRVHDQINNGIEAVNTPPIIKTVVMDLFKPEKQKPANLTPKTNPSGGPKTNAVSNVIKDSVPENKVTTVNIIPNNNSNNNNNNANPDPNSNGTGSVSANGNSSITISNDPTPDPEVAPVFEGGFGALARFISSNIVYPELAKEINLEGKVYLSFVVNEKGEVESVKIQRGIGGGCDEEATRVVNKIPKFKLPGKVRGQAVKVLFNIPIFFKLK